MTADGRLIVGLTEILLAHILYMREMIPVTLNHLRSLSVEYPTHENQKQLVEQTSRKEFQRKKVAFQYVSEMQDLFGAFAKAITATANAERSSNITVSIVLGPSLSNPKETYCLHFMKNQTEYNCDSEESLNKTINRLGKILIRRMLEFSFANSLTLQAPKPNWNYFLVISVLNPVILISSEISKVHHDEVDIVNDENSFFVQIAGSDFKLKQPPEHFPVALRAVNYPNFNTVTSKEMGPRVVRRSKAAKGVAFPVEVTVDCCSGTISPCSTGNDSRIPKDATIMSDDNTASDGGAMSGSDLETGTSESLGSEGEQGEMQPEPLPEVEQEKQKEWELSHWWVQRKGVRGIKKGIFA